MYKLLASGFTAIRLLMPFTISDESDPWVDADGARHSSNTPAPEDVRVANRFSEERFKPEEEQKIREAEDGERAKLQGRLAQARAQREQERQDAGREQAEKREEQNQRRINELERKVEELNAAGRF